MHWFTRLRGTEMGELPSCLTMSEKAQFSCTKHRFCVLVLVFLSFLPWWISIHAHETTLEILVSLSKRIKSFTLMSRPVYKRTLLGCLGSPKWLCPPRERQILRRRIPKIRRDGWYLQDSNSFHCLPRVLLPCSQNKTEVLLEHPLVWVSQKEQRIIILWRNIFCIFFSSVDSLILPASGGQLVPSLLPFHLDFRAWVASKVEPLIKAI